jgi:hypothetical protein
MFAKRHYEQIADVMRETWPGCPARGNEQWLMTLKALVRTFERDNPRFDAQRFIAACRLVETRQKGAA